ncbi:MAG: hypothetical protein V4650_08195 [Pseudomonadota bacterium]
MTAFLTHALFWLLWATPFPLSLDYLFLLVIGRFFSWRMVLPSGLLIVTAHLWMFFYRLESEVSIADLAEMVVKDWRMSLAAAAIVLGLVAALLLDGWLVRRLGGRPLIALFVLGSAALLGVHLADQARQVRQKPVLSPLISVAKRLSNAEKREWTFQKTLRLTAARPLKTESITHRLVKDLAQQGPEGILLMHVESMGLPKKEAQIRTLLSELQALHPSHAFTLQAEPFQSFTLPNEVRVLCNLKLKRLFFPPNTNTDDCLPNRLVAQGWSTLAIHNNRGDYYQRDQWYPKVGFQRFENLDTLVAAGLPRCDLHFDAICDQQVPPYLLSLKLESPYFVYWLSIDSHMPVTAQAQTLVQPGDPERADCELSDPHCIEAVQWDLVKASVKHFFAMANALPKAVLIAKGDHRPPFADRDSNPYSAEQVPIILAVPVSAPLPAN